jgi:hypothetical protein
MSAPPPRQGRFFGLLHSAPLSRGALRKLILKATAAGLSALSLGSTAPAYAEAKIDLPTPTIENRTRRGFAKLVLRMKGPGGRLLASHGSHSSHSSHSSHASHASHASHYSSTSGENTSGESTSGEPSISISPSSPPARAPRSRQDDDAARPGAVEHTTRITITGIDAEERKLTGKDASHLEHVFHYGPRLRIRRRGSSVATPLDQLARDPNDLPFKWGNKVTVTWTTATDGTKKAVELSLD